MWYYINLLVIVLAYWSQYNHKNSRSVHNIPIHFEYLKNKLCGLDVNWQPISGTLLFMTEHSLFLGYSVSSEILLSELMYYVTFISTMTE